jgi:hypothetical protein
MAKARMKEVRYTPNFRHPSEAAFPPHFISVRWSKFPGTEDVYTHTEMVLPLGLPDPARGIHGRQMVDMIFRHFTQMNILNIPKKCKGSYTITRDEWQSFSFLMCDFDRKYSEIKLY